MYLSTRIGGKESNSFVTLAEADLLIAVLPDDTSDWEVLSDDQKRYRLVMAAALMSNLPWRWKKSFEGQSLCFPRNGNKSVPDEIKETQVFLAYSVIHRGLANRPEIDEADGDRVTQVSLGGLLTVSFAAGKSQSYTSLEKMIQSAQFPAYVRVLKYLTSFRGRTVPDDDDIDLLTTTTT